MLRNNNEAVLNRMAKNSLKNNRRRSMIMISAVFLAAFMIFSVFTAGVTYFKMQRIQNIRLSGAEFDAVLFGLTEKQQTMCENNPDIESAGIAAVAGYGISTETDDTVNLGFIWADDTYWNTFMKPAREWVKGEYPQKADQVMATKKALKECGLENLGIGDSFTMTYEDSLGEHTKKFRICGMWDGYGDKDVFYVSKDFYEQSGQELASVASGRYYLIFKQKIMTDRQQEALIESLHLGKQQHLFFQADFRYSVGILAGMLGIILITCLCAYLLIYNIMYLSISGNIRYYGLCQTVGMTQRQVYRFVLKQMMLVGVTGIAGGILAGCGVDFFLIPVIVKTLGIRTGQAGRIQISFHPAIFLLTVLVTGITVYMGGKKPARMATAISPVEALGYQKISGKRGGHKTGKGNIPWRMARWQITRDKKEFGVVVLSLAASLSVFLCIVTLIESQGARTLVSNYMDMDMVIKNDTLKIEDHDTWEQILDEEFLDRIRKTENVDEVHSLLCTEITVPWEPDFSDVWMREFYETWMNIPYEEEAEEYREHPENFGSFLVGIDETEFEYLNSMLEAPADKEEFLKGKTCILYRNGLEFQTGDLKGKQVTCADYRDGEKKRTFKIAGLTDENYYTGALMGYPPTIIVSDQAVKEFAENPFVYKTSIRYQQEYDEKTEEEILGVIQESSHAKDFSYDSKIDEMKEVKKAQGNMMEVGMGIVLILAFIGILNYINTILGNIQSRQREMATLESIGMTKKQLNHMLALEGLLYVAGTLALTMTVGMGITYYLYQSMNYRGIPFQVPFLPVMAAVCLILLVCTGGPLLAYKYIEKKGTVAERIRIQ